MTFYRKPLALAFLLLCTSTFVFAQNRQMDYLHDSLTLFINDTQLDSGGYLVHVGYLYSAKYSSRWGIIMKTDRAGNVLWSRTGILSSIECKKVIIARNRDYIILQNYPYRVIRMDENGNPKWQQGYNFNSNWGDGVGDITELPNGNIAVCGTNYFGSVGKDVGILVMLDSAGTRIFGKSYGGALMLRTDVNSFHSITATDSNILIVGRQWHTRNALDGGLLVVADFNGNVVNTYLLDKTPYASGPDSLYKPQFSDIMVKGGKIYVNGTISIYRNSVTRNRTWQLFGTIDTNTRTFSGHTAHVGKDDYVTNPEFFVTDSGKYLISLSSKEYEFASPRNRYFLCGISGDSVEYVVKIANDSLATVKALNLVNDTAIATGGINASDKRGYFFYYKENSVNIKSCSIADSVISLDTIVRQVKDPYEGSYMPVTNWPMNRLFHDTLDYGYISERQVCGDTICSPVFEAMLDTLTATTVCYGDSVILFERTKYPKAWIRDNTTLQSMNDTLVVKSGGVYKVVISNYLQCRDTDSINVVVHPLPQPVVYHNFDTISTNTTYQSYQWFNKAGDIMGATNHKFVPGYTDSFAVRVTDSNGCVGIAPFYHFIPLHVATNKRPVLQVFPNPVNPLAVLHIANASGEPYNGELFDVTGRTIRQLHILPGLNDYSLNGELDNGLYIMRLANVAGVSYLRIVVR